ncbi:MAG: DUF507 family protein [Campylobacteraceae bacterium]|nr:DUF507 family protein [Campylobacteraceae bacterium]
MRLKQNHVQYISRKISKDLVNCDFIEIRSTKEAIAEQVAIIMTADIKKESVLDEAVANLLDNQEDDIEFYKADYRQLFWMTKKRMANEYGVNLNNSERFSDIAHQILDFLYEEDFIHFTVNDNQVKNIIIESIENFMSGFDDADSAAYEKIKNYQRKLIPGTDDYNDIFNRLYEEELVRRGLI